MINGQGTVKSIPAPMRQPLKSGYFLMSGANPAGEEMGVNNRFLTLTGKPTEIIREVGGFGLVGEYAPGEYRVEVSFQRGCPSGI